MTINVCMYLFVYLIEEVILINYEYNLGSIIGKTNAKMKNNLARALKPYNVTHEQWPLLKWLWVQDGISQKQLSEITFKDQPTITRILDKLERRGLIRRQADPVDRRISLIYLTREGQEIRAALTPLALQALDHALQGLSEQEQDELKNLLNRISDNLD
ncbi:MarR family winged helix-turn-helix transcriptional regulator [Desulfosporosinus fructosivorans]|nr:MarR family transcriptional regulator [Desulfosporosinus fructosivorans]